jgi:preprotein translocase subunit SecF
VLSGYRLVATIVVALSLAVGGFFFGMKYQKGQDARAEQLVAKVKLEAQLGAAEAISKIKVVNTTVKQKLETQIREREVYRDCKLDDDSFRLLNSALTARPLAAGSGELSGTDSADR